MMEGLEDEVLAAMQKAVKDAVNAAGGGFYSLNLGDKNVVVELDSNGNLLKIVKEIPMPTVYPKGAVFEIPRNEPKISREEAESLLERYYRLRSETSRLQDSPFRGAYTLAVEDVKLLKEKIIGILTGETPT